MPRSRNLENKLKPSSQRVMNDFTADFTRRGSLGDRDIEARMPYRRNHSCEGATEQPYIRSTARLELAAFRITPRGPSIYLRRCGLHDIFVGMGPHTFSAAGALSLYFLV